MEKETDYLYERNSSLFEDDRFLFENDEDEIPCDEEPFAFSNDEPAEAQNIPIEDLLRECDPCHEMDTSLPEKLRSACDTLYDAFGKHALLTCEEEYELGRRVQSGDESAFERFVMANGRLVVATVCLVVRRSGNPGILDFEDLIHEGVLGLMTAVRRFNPERKCRFSTYALPWIYMSVSRAKNSHRRGLRVPGNAGEDIAKYASYIALYRSGRTKEIPKRVLRRVRVLAPLVAPPVSLCDEGGAPSSENSDGGDVLDVSRMDMNTGLVDQQSEWSWESMIDDSAMREELPALLEKVLQPDENLLVTGLLGIGRFKGHGALGVDGIAEILGRSKDNVRAKIARITRKLARHPEMRLFWKRWSSDTDKAPLSSSTRRQRKKSAERRHEAREDMRNSASNEHTRGMTCVEMFGGIGAIRDAAMKAGITVLRSCEENEFHIEVLRNNPHLLEYGGVPVPFESKAFLAPLSSRPDILIGTFRLNVKRRILPREAELLLASAEHFHPRCVLCDIDESLFERYNGHSIEIFLDGLDRCGFKNRHETILSSLPFVPHLKRRGFILAFADDEPKATEVLAAAEQAVEQSMRSRAKTPTLAEILHREDESERGIPDMELCLDEKTGRVKKRFYTQANLCDVEGRSPVRATPNDVAASLTPRYFKKSGYETLVQTENGTLRRFTPRELARLFGYDDSFSLGGNGATMAILETGIVIPLLQTVLNVVMASLGHDGHSDREER
jgi:RNA polymerase primary sigma factor